MTPLRNRDFVLLQTGQLLSAAGSASTALAYPLLVLALGGSAAEAGAVSFASLAAYALVSVPAGLAADRRSRRRLMIGADCARAVAVAALGAALAWTRVPVAAILAVAAVEGAGSAVFGAAQAGALRAVVPAAQLPDAVGVQEARRAVVRVGGAPLGGVLFGLGRAVPFLVDACSYACSSLSLVAMRAPFEERAEPPEPAPLRARLAEGFRFVWDVPFMRTTTFLYGFGNVISAGMLLALVVVARAQGLSPAQVGGVTAVFGVGTLAGSLVSPLVRRALSTRAILLLELWSWLALWAFVARPSVYVLTAALLPFGLTAPVTDSVVVGLRVALTPDRLLGRVESVRVALALALAPLGPIAAGALLGAVDARWAIAAFAAAGLALAVCGTLSRGLRDAPSVRAATRTPAA